jgi:hypothetical protein
MWSGVPAVLFSIEIFLSLLALDNRGKGQLTAGMTSLKDVQGAPHVAFAELD